MANTLADFLPDPFAITAHCPCGHSVQIDYRRRHLERVERFVEDEDAPLLEPPAVEGVTINAVCFDGVDDIRLVIGEPFEEPPKMS